MDFGLTLPQGAQRDLQRDVIKVATQAEQAGYAGLWAYERVLFPLNPADGLYGIDGLPWIDYYRHCADPLTVLTLAQREGAHWDGGQPNHPCGVMQGCGAAGDCGGTPKTAAPRS